jgi:hypothetical protein
MVHSSWSILARADAVTPVVPVGEATARPTQVGRAQLAQRADDVRARRTILLIANAAVDATAEVFKHEAKDMP